MKNKVKPKSGNKKIIRRMLLAIILILFLMVAFYYIAKFADLGIRAENSLNRYWKDYESFIEDREMYQVYWFFALDDAYFESVDEEPYWIPPEEELRDYYLDNRDRFEHEKVYRFVNGSDYAFFMPLEKLDWMDDSYGFPEGYDLLLYTDVSAYARLLGSDVLIFIAAMAVFVLLLFILTRSTIRELDQKDEQMKNFFANMSHELKTPLMAIKGNADGIISRYVEPDDGCRVIEKEADRMSSLIGSILDLSRIDSGVVKADMELNDVREIIYDAASSLLQTAESKGIHLEMLLPEPVFRKCDENMMFSAFANILSNDIRYAERLIRIRSEHRDNEKIAFIFENDGSVISEEDSRHIFDRYYKGGNGQTGIGMALAQEYVKLHNSEIRVSAKDNMTVFEIVL